MTTQALNFSLSTPISLDTICSKLSDRAYRVWSLILTMGEEGAKDIWIRQQTLADQMGVSISKIGRAIKELVKAEYLILKGERHEKIYKTYERTAEYCHPRTCSGDPSPDEGSGLDCRNKSGNDNNVNNSHVVAGFPQKLLDEVAAIKASTRSESQRMTLITNMFLQFLPANAANDDQPVVLLRDPPIISPAIGTPLSDNIDDLRAQHQKVLREQKPGFGMAMHVINQRISVLEKQRSGVR